MLVSSYFKPKVFAKMPYLTYVPAEMVIVLGAQLKIWGKILGESKNHIGETIARKLGINLKTLKNCNFKKLKSKHADSSDQ